MKFKFPGSFCVYCLSLFFCFPSVAGEQSIADFQVYRSGEISDIDTVREIESLETISAIELKILEGRQRQTLQRRDRIKNLYDRGQTSRISMDSAAMDLQDINDQVDSLTNFRMLLNSLLSGFGENSFIESPAGRQNPVPEFQVRLPGLTLRNGGVDLFTARLKAGADTTFATKKYTATKLKAEFAPPHKKIVHDFYGGRHTNLSNLSSARQTELDRSRFYLSTVNHLQLLANHRFAARWRKGQRIESYSGYVNDPGNGAQQQPEKIYSGSSDSFWLFGDGDAVAKFSGTISTSDMHFAERKASSTHTVTRARANVQSLQLRHNRLLGLQKNGFSNRAELRESQLGLNLAKLNLKKAEAEQVVANREFEQIKSAAAVVTAFAEPTPVPEENGIGKNSDEAWLKWIENGPTPDSDDLLRLLELIKDRFLSATEKSILERRSQYENERLAKYQGISSVYAVELEIQRDRLTDYQTRHARALEQENLSVLKIQQWARNILQQTQTPLPAPPGEVMEKIVLAGKAVNEAKAAVAKIEIRKKELRHKYDVDYLERLQQLRQSGSANSYEVAKAENQMLRSNGSLYSEVRNLAVINQEAKFLDAIYASGSMTFDENGLTISRFMPEAVKELEKLAILKDSVDEGLLLQYEARLADSKNQIAELNRLIKSGHASPVELEFADIRKKQIENNLASEKARARALPYALALIQSLEFKPAEKQDLKPAEDLKL